MALTTPLPEVPDSRVHLGEGCIQASFWIIPGTSDYPTSGYVITPSMCRLMRGFQSAWIGGENATVIAGPWLMIPVMSMALTSNGYPSMPTQVSLYVIQANLTQVSASTNLTGAVWVLTVTGN
jgi:hypothetical protein